MDLGIKGLRVLVTAGASGIGLEISRAFEREGAKVHICDVDSQALAAVAKSDPTLTQSVCDVSDRAQVARLPQRLGERDLFRAFRHALKGVPYTDFV